MSDSPSVPPALRDAIAVALRGKESWEPFELTLTPDEANNVGVRVCAVIESYIQPGTGQADAGCFRFLSEPRSDG